MSGSAPAACARAGSRTQRRVGRLAGWYIITYGLGIYVLNLLIGFLSPQLDPETEGPTLPTSKDDEFRPFIRRHSTPPASRCLLCEPAPAAAFCAGYQSSSSGTRSRKPSSSRS